MRRLLGLILCLGSCPGLHAEQDFPVIPGATPDLRVDHYCGLYCIHQSAKLHQRQLNLDQLFDRKYITGVFGSTVEDLQQCASDFDLKARHFHNFSYFDALLLGKPVAVLIRSHFQSPLPDHWILFLDGDLYEARLFDPSMGVITVPSGELQALWGGTALLVEPTDKVDSSAIWLSTITKLSILAIIGGALVLALSCVHAYLSSAWLTLFSSSVVLAVAFHTLTPMGFVQNRSIVDMQLAVGSDRDVPQLSPQDYLQSPDQYVVIDARNRGQYLDNRISGSINIPYQDSYWVNREAVSRLDPNKPVLFYCLSENCQWATDLAKSPLFSRFSSVSVLQGGIVGYAQAGGSVDTKPIRSGQ